jgi:hypothetical protein
MKNGGSDASVFCFGAEQRDQTNAEPRAALTGFNPNLTDILLLIFKALSSA